MKKASKARRIRKNGTTAINAIMIEKNYKYGDVIKQKSVSVRKHIIITGIQASGKSHIIQRLYDEALNVWGGQPKINCKLLIRAIDPIGSWCERPDITKYFNANNEDKQWKQLKAWEKQNYLKTFCSDFNTVVFIDDANILSNRKLSVALRCVQSAKIAVVSTSNENRLPPTLRQFLLKKDPQIIRLDSSVSKDGTDVFLWIIILISMIAGMYEISLVLGALKVLGRGIGAARQD